MVWALRPARLAAAALLLLAGAARPADAKLAFLFVAAGPLPLAETWERFFAPAPKDQYSIHVHTHPNVTRASLRGSTHPSSTVFCESSVSRVDLPPRTRSDRRELVPHLRGHRD